MQKYCSSYIKQWEMTPTSTMPEMNSGASMTITTLPITEEQRRKRTKMGQKSQSKKFLPREKQTPHTVIKSQKLILHWAETRVSLQPPWAVSVSQPYAPVLSLPLHTNIQAQAKSISILDIKFKPKLNQTLKKLLTQPLTKNCVHTSKCTKIVLGVHLLYQALNCYFKVWEMKRLKRKVP